MTTPPTFSAGSILTAAQMNAVGMWKITSTTFSSSSLVSISNAFTTDYSHYVVMGSFVGTGNSYALARLQKAGAASTTGYYLTGNYTTYSSSAVNGYSGSNQSSFACGQYTSASNDGTTLKWDVFNPKSSTLKTVLNTHFVDVGIGQQYTFDVIHAVTDSYDGFTITPQGGTTITGTVTVYGMR